jgi:hypothetical protein
VAVAQETLTCEWEEKGFTLNCDAYRAWTRSDALEGADQTLLNMLEDDNEQVRFLAATILNERQVATTYREEAAEARRVVVAAGAEETDVVAFHLGGAVAVINFGAVDDAALASEIVEMMQSHPVASARAGLASRLMGVNRAHPELFEVYLEVARGDEDAQVRREAQAGLRASMPDEAQQAMLCELWSEAAADGDGDVASQAAEALTDLTYCREHWDALLETLRARAEAGHVASADDFKRFPKVLHNIHRHADATPDQRTRAVEVARALVENEANDGRMRQQTSGWLEENSR